MTIAKINGVDLNYEVIGRGEKAVVFLHGFTGSTLDWANQASALSPEYRLVAYDQRGHGKSAAPSKAEDYSVPVYTEDVCALLDLLGIKKCCLVGHSLGGFVALDFALKHKDRLAGLVLVDTSSGQFVVDPEYARLRAKLDELARSQGMEAAFEYDATNNPMRVEVFQRHPGMKEVARRKMMMTSVDGYVIGWAAISNREPVTSRLGEIKVPTLIFWGDEDIAFTEAVHIMREGINGAELVTVKGVGHSPHEEAPAVFNEAILKFLKKVKW